jgi:DNA-binding MarR family transcriptional regulator
VKDVADRIREAWVRERPDLDFSSIGILTRLVRISRHLQRARSVELAAIGSDASMLDLLATLRRAGKPYRLTPGELEQASLVSAGAISQRLDRAERQGLVRRTRDEGDRRVFHVELTGAGRAEVDRVVAELMERESELLQPLTEEERRLLEQLLKRWLKRFERDS